MQGTSIPCGCHFKFCIYNYNNDCYCGRISHDELGTCTSRIFVEVDDDDLHEMKREQLTRYNMEKFGLYTTVPNRTRRNVMREVAVRDDNP